MKRITLFLISMILCLAACTAVKVEKLDEDPLKRAQGLYYALPQVDLKVKATYQKVVADTGKWNKYKYLLPEYASYVKADTTIYKLKGFEITPIPRRDDSAVYFVTFRGRSNPFVRQNSSFKINSQGILTHSNVEYEDQTIAVGVQVAELAIESIIGFVTSKAEGGMGSLGTKGSPMPEILCEDRSLSLEFKMAKRVAEEVRTIRQERMALLKSPMNGQDKSAELKLRLEELKAQEEKLVQLFLGKVTVKEHTREVIIEAHRLKETIEVPMFAFSPKKGLQVLKPDGAMPSQGDFIEIKLRTNSISMTALSAHAQDREDKGKGHHGIYYRIPADVRLSITAGDDKTLAETQMLIPQMGTLAFLPARVSLFKNTLEADLDPTTGSLREFRMKGEPADSATQASGMAVLKKLFEEEDDEDEEEEDDELEEIDEALIQD